MAFLRSGTPDRRGGSGRPFARIYYRGAHGTIVVYDGSTKESVNNVKQCFHKVDIGEGHVMKSRSKR